MNIYVVRQATQGLANWVKTQGGTQTVAISYDIDYHALLQALMLYLLHEATVQALRFKEAESARSC